MALTNYKKWQIVLVDLNPVKGSEMNKVRPCLIISPNAANKHLRTVIIAPFTSSVRHIPTRLPSVFNGVTGEICFDQVKTIDKTRIKKVLGVLDSSAKMSVNTLLINMFSEL